jgi:hypothetical protein
MFVLLLQAVAELMAAIRIAMIPVYMVEVMDTSRREKSEPGRSSRRNSRV